MRPRFSHHSNAPWRFHFSVRICLHSSAVDGSDACVWTPLTTAHAIHLQQQLFMRRRGGCGVAVLALARLFVHHLHWLVYFVHRDQILTKVLRIIDESLFIFSLLAVGCIVGIVHCIACVVFMQ
jgi:hypothetical protein